MKVLICIDGSEYSKAALDAVASRPWYGDTEFIVLTVIPYSTAAFSDMVNARATATLQASLREQIEAMLMEQTESLRKRLPAYKVTPRLREGNPRDEIASEAAAENIDLIVVGSHGRTGIKRFLLGSIAEGVLHAAPCSVEVVKKQSVPLESPDEIQREAQESLLTKATKA